MSQVFLSYSKVDHFFDAFKAMLTGIGWDMNFGTNTLKCLKDNGLDMLSSEGRSYAFFGGSHYAERFVKQQVVRRQF